MKGQVPAAIKVINYLSDGGGSTLSSGARLTLVVLASYANPDGSNCFPSRATLAPVVGVKEQQVGDHIEALEKAGEVAVRRSPGRVNHYAIECCSGEEPPYSTTPVPPRSTTGDPPAQVRGTPVLEYTRPSNNHPEDHPTDHGRTEEKESGNSDDFVDKTEVEKVTAFVAGSFGAVS